MKNILNTIGLTTALALGVSTSSAQDSTVIDTVTETATDIVGGIQCTDETGCLIAGIRFGNPFDPSSWWNANEGSKAGSTIVMNFADPDFWMMFAEPETRGILHASFLNPATYTQFLDLNTYTNMMDPTLIKKWFDIGTYDTILDPQTYAYFMQPGAYSHLIELDHYLQFTQLTAYDDVWATALSTLDVSE